MLAGRDGYDVTGGEVLLQDDDLLDLEPEERAREGIFLAFQYPVEIPGVNSAYFLTIRRQRDPQASRRRGTRCDEVSQGGAREMKELGLSEDFKRRSTPVFRR